jgi:hypothetical protein
MRELSIDQWVGTLRAPGVSVIPGVFDYVLPVPPPLEHGDDRDRGKDDECSTQGTLRQAQPDDDWLAQQNWPRRYSHSLASPVTLDQIAK